MKEKSNSDVSTTNLLPKPETFYFPINPSYFNPPPPQPLAPLFMSLPYLSITDIIKLQHLSLIFYRKYVPSLLQDIQLLTHKKQEHFVFYNDKRVFAVPYEVIISNQYVNTKNYVRLMKEDVHDEKVKMLDRSSIEWRVQFQVPLLRLVVLTELDVHLMVDLGSQEVTQLPESGSARRKFGSCYKYGDQFIYTVGGIKMTEKLQSSYSGGCMGEKDYSLLKQCHKFDTGNLLWREMPDLTVERVDPMLVNTGQWLYAVGGNTYLDGQTDQTIERIETKNQRKWRLLPKV